MGIQTPSLASVVQQVVSRSGFGVNRSMVFIISGSGTRSAASYEGDPRAAPLLHVEFNP
jgi:hypothetical protein